MPQQSFSRFLLLKITGSIGLLVVIAVSWVNCTNVLLYLDVVEQAQSAQELVTSERNEAGALPFLDDHFVDESRSHLYRGIGFSFFFLALGIAVSLFAVKSLRSPLNRDFKLLKQRIDTIEDGTDSRGDTPDFDEFEALSVTLENLIGKQSQIRFEHQRIEAEMARASEDLSVSFETLKQEHEATLQIMKEAKSAVFELEAENEHLEKVIQQFRSSEGRPESPIAPLANNVSPQKVPRETSRGSSVAGLELGKRYPLKIVVAEDNAANQRVLKIMLRRLGWSADFVNDGQQLLDFLADSPVDLVLMDLQMPIMDGLEATGKLREGAVGEHLKGVKIIALTANAMKSDEEHCIRSGMDGYLSKPIRIDFLKKKIVEVFGFVDDQLA